MPEAHLPPPEPPREQRETEAPKEIERKFLVRALPEGLDQFAHDDIAQGYVEILPDGTERRVRKKGDKHYLTVKSGTGRTRSESEQEITEAAFQEQWQATEGRRVEKTRYSIPHGDRTIELDIYRGALDGLIVVEVEFPDQETSEKFVPLDWFGDEVTEDSRFKNQQLALHGMPKDEAEGGE